MADVEQPAPEPIPEESPTLPARTFHLPVDEKHRARRIVIWSIRRPHMRAFHFAWLSFFLAFFGWFAVSPLLKTIRAQNEWLTEDNVVDSNQVSVAGTILMRLLIGPFCDRFGPRWSQSLLVIIFSIPVFLVGTANSFAAFTSARFFIGFIGATFVVTQFWTSIMFSSNVVGTANATSAGWGNLGGGVTNALMPQIFNGFRKAGLSEDRAWRVSMVVPGTALILVGVSLFFLSDDLPDGNYRTLEKAGTKTKTNPFVAFGRASKNWRSWVLFALYACCFGVELIMNGNLALYFADEFDVDQGKAGLIAALFGLMNLFARSLGGIVSDVSASKYSMRGRLWAFFTVQLMEGLMLLTFSRMTSLPPAIVTLILFSLFTQMAEGATFGIVPFVDPEATGAVSGIVGAGGNFGAVTLGFLFKVGEKRAGLLYLAFVVIGSAFTVALLHWPQYGGMFCKPSIKTKQIDDDSAEANGEVTSDDAEKV